MQQSKFKSLILGLSGPLLLSACKAQGPASDEASGVSEAAASGQTLPDGIHFNLAAYARTNPQMAPLAALAVPGDAYLRLGEEKTFAVQTNANADGKAPPGIAPKLDANVWASASALGVDLGAKSKLVEVSTEANANPISLSGAVRYRGQEKFHGELTTSWDQTFTRSMATDAVVPTPVPGLGVKFGANIGGEFGAKIDPSVRGDEALTMAFIPHMAFSAGVTGGLSTAAFLGAEAFGSVTILETKLSHYGTLGYHPTVGIAAGTLGIEDGNMTWLSGKVGIRAVSGPKGSSLPAGINRMLWTAVTMLVPGADQTWEHVLWEPKPLRVDRLPGFARFMERFVKSPSSRSECLQQVAKFEPKVEEIKQKVETVVKRLNEQYEKDKEESLKDQMRAAATIKTNYQTILSVAQSECATL